MKSDPGEFGNRHRKLGPDRSACEAINKPHRDRKVTAADKDVGARIAHDAVAPNIAVTTGDVVSVPLGAMPMIRAM